MKECLCGCGTLIPDKDKQYRKLNYVINHDKRKPIKQITCGCGCGQLMPERLDHSYFKRTFIPGHQHFLRRIQPTKINCACGCGEVIDDVRRKSNGKPYKVKYQKGYNRKGADVKQFWKGGKTAESRRFKQSGEYRQWRKSVFERDNYTCQICGVRNERGLGRTIALHPDHIKSSSQFPELRIELDNGRTLCAECHRKTDNYGVKAWRFTSSCNSSSI